MDVAVFSELLHADRVFASMQLVDYLSRCGLHARLVTRRHKDESRIRIGYEPMLASSGFDKARAIISAHVMSRSIVKRWRRSNKLVIHIATLQMTLDQDAIDSIRECDCVVSPALSVTTYLRSHFPDIRVINCPWHVPQMRTTVQLEPTGAFVPAYTHVPSPSHLTAFIAATLAGGGRLTIELGGGSKLRCAIRNHFKPAVEAGMLNVIPPLNYAARLAAMTRCQVVAAIAPGSPFAMPALFAAAVGRPVLGFDLPPYNEIVRPGQTGVLIPGWRKTDTTAMTAAGRSLAAMLTDHASLLPLIQGAMTADDRRTAFGLSWFSALGENFLPELA